MCCIVARANFPFYKPWFWSKLLLLFLRLISLSQVACLEQTMLTPKCTQIFFGGADEFEIDPQQEWVMVEPRHGSFYEGSRHTLRSLQMLSRES